jgi:hypothetical protein
MTAEEQRKQRQEIRRDEIHKVRYATAEINLQLKQRKFLASTAASEPITEGLAGRETPIGYANAVL